MSSTARDRALVAASVCLLALVVASPWPFGSVTPRLAGLLTASLTLLGGSVVAVLAASSSPLPRPPAWPWLAALAMLLTAQQIPWPSTVTTFIAPGVGAAYAAADAAREQATLWRPLTVERFQTLWRSLELLGLALAFYASWVLFERDRARRTLAYAIAGAGVALSLFAVYQKARFGTVLYGRFPTASGTPFGPFVNHNHFAGWVGSAALVALGVAWRTKARHGALALLLFGAAAVMGIGHVLSQSRGGLLAGAGGLAVFVWLAREGKTPRLLLPIASAVGVAAFLVAFAPSSVSSRWTGLAEYDRSVAFRAQLWSDSVGLALSSPLVGSGLGTYAAVIPAHRTGPDETRAEYAESDWVQALCETGLVGLALALGFGASILASGLRAIRAEKPGRARGVREGAFAAVVALGLHGLVDFNFHIPSNALLAAVLLGVLPERTSVNAPRARIAAAGFVSLAVMAAALCAVRLGESREIARRVDPVLTGPAELSMAIRTLTSSRERGAQNPQTAFLLGRLYNEEAYRAAGQGRYRDVRLGQASAAFRDAIGLAPARGRFWFELAWTEANRGNDAVAERLFPRALELEPHWANLRANYALYLVSRARVDEALRQLEIGLALEPGLEPSDALRIVGPHLEGDRARLLRAAGAGKDAEAAVSRYLAEREASE